MGAFSQTTRAHGCGCGGAHLTIRDVEILLLLAAGLASKQIALQLGISRRTVEDHVSAMRQRAAAQGIAGLITRCYAAEILIPAWPPQWSGSYCLQSGHSKAPRHSGIEPTEWTGQDCPKTKDYETPGPHPVSGRQARPPLIARSEGVAAASKTAPEAIGGMGAIQHNLVGLAVSTGAQDAQLERAALSEAGCGQIFEEKTCTGKAARPGLAAALGYLRPGDTLCLWKLDRLGRSVKEILMIADGLRHRRIGLKILTGKFAGTYTSTCAGSFFTVMTAFAELERDIRHEHTMAGLAAARACGRTGGRPTVMDGDKLAAARARHANGESLTQIAEALGISRATIYRHLNEQPA
jgi:DNA invertase Pin-like site-specific DNA recombinase